MSQQLYDMLFRALQSVIDQERNRNEARFAYWEVMSNRNWTSPEFSRLVDQMEIYFAMFSPDFPRNTPIEDVVWELAQEWVRLDLGDYVITDRTLSERVDDNAYREAQDSAGRKAEMLRQMERFVNSQRQSGGGYRDSYRDQGAQRNQGWRQPVQQSSGVTGGLAGVVRAAAGSAQPVPQERRSTAASRLQPTASTGVVATASSVERQPLAQPVAAAPREVLDGPDHTKPRPYDEFVIKGETWRPAHLSGWTLSPDICPFATAYDINEKVRFHVKDKDGKVREEFINMSTEIDYLRHELMGTTSRQAKKRTAPLYTRSGVVPHEASNKKEEKPMSIYADLKLNVDDVPTAAVAVSNLEEAEVIAAGERLKTGSKIGVSHVIVQTPFMVDEQTIEVMEDLVNSLNLTDAVRQMVEGEPEMDPSLFNYINGFLAHRVTHVLRNQYGVAGSLSDFCEDYPQALDYLRTNKGEAWARAFSQNTRYLVREGFSYVDQTDTAAKAYLSGILDITEEQVEQTLKAVVMQTFYTVASVDFRLSDFRLMLDETAQIIHCDTHPELYALIKKLFDCNTKAIDIGRVYIRTKEGLRIEVLINASEDDCYMARMMV